MISNTLKQTFFLQLQRLDTSFLKHQIFSSSLWSGVPDPDHRTTRNIKHVPPMPSVLIKSYDRSYAKSEALFHNQLVSCNKNLTMNFKSIFGLALAWQHQQEEWKRGASHRMCSNANFLLEPNLECLIWHQQKCGAELALRVANIYGWTEIHDPKIAIFMK